MAHTKADDRSLVTLVRLIEDVLAKMESGCEGHCVGTAVIMMMLMIKKLSMKPSVATAVMMVSLHTLTSKDLC
jgi:hypothetical protein